MRKVLLVVSLLALAGLFACNGEDEGLKKELNEANTEVESLKKQVRSKEDELDDQTTKNLRLGEELRELETAKERGAIELSNLKWEENDRDFKLILHGTAKNTGRVYLYDVTVKVAIMDRTENIIEAPVVNDLDREKMPMLFFHEVTGSLNTGDSKDFSLVIYTRNIHASGLGKVKESIREQQGDNTWKVTGLFNSAGQ